MTEQTFVSLHLLARRTRLPTSWLREEARAGRIPSLRVSRRLMFNLEEVEAALRARSRPEGEEVTRGDA
ncbi:MAG: hypothetical protein KDA21_15400 [Phycisphaerales bacterium]|nr:hypothetical protein [Phycisphaerales bacterium]